MTDEQDFGTITLDIRHMPDSSLEQGPDGNKQRVALPGKYQIGAVVQGAFVPLAVIGADRLQKHMDRAASGGGPESQQTGPTQPQPTDPSQQPQQD